MSTMQPPRLDSDPGLLMRSISEMFETLETVIEALDPPFV